MLTRLLNLRKERKITQQRLAVDIGIDQASISSYESGKYYPTIEVLVKLADYFGVSTDYLLDISDMKRPANDFDEQTLSMLKLYLRLPQSYRERVYGYIEGLLSEIK